MAFLPFSPPPAHPQYQGPANNCREASQRQSFARTECCHGWLGPGRQPEKSLLVGVAVLTGDRGERHALLPPREFNQGRNPSWGCPGKNAPPGAPICPGISSHLVPTIRDATWGVWFDSCHPAKGNCCGSGTIQHDTLGHVHFCHQEDCRQGEEGRACGGLVWCRVFLDWEAGNALGPWK